jgi:hypothetical protein
MMDIGIVKGECEVIQVNVKNVLVDMLEQMVIVNNVVMPMDQMV